MKNFVLFMSFVIGSVCLFGQEMPTSSRIDQMFYGHPHDIYIMKYPLHIRNGKIFDYHTDTCPNYLANDSKEIPKDSKPFGFTSDEEYVCYFKKLDEDIYGGWSQIILRSAKDGTIRLVYPPASPQPPRAMVPKIPVLNSQGNLIAMLANNNGGYRKNLEHLTFFRYPRVTVSPRLLQFLLVVDIESGKTLHAIPTLDCYNSKAFGLPFERKELNSTPRWPSEDLALFMPDDSGILVRQSCFQINLYDFGSERTIQCFDVLKTHGVKVFISTFMLTDDEYLRTFLHSSGPHLEALSDRSSRDNSEVPDYIDWNIKTGEIVREGPLRESVIH